MQLRTLASRAAQVALTAAVLAAVVVLGQIPWGSSTGEAVLRLALRTVHGKIEVCRQQSPEELEALPPHMRQAEICDTYPVRYRLRVELDGRELIDEEFEPGGLRRDRPHNVDREFTVASGNSRLEVSFLPRPPEEATPEVEAELGDLPRYVVSRQVRFAPDRVTLVYLDDAAGGLEILEPSNSGG